MFFINTFKFNFFYIILVFINVQQNTADMKLKKLTIRISEDLSEKYKIFCNENGFSQSKRIRLLLENDIKNNGNK